ncbi:hypothetical protein [Achromobacter pestifer]|uniref:Uncharacterized protein n=1 Tax=Achromobacter pestifer TaxID=1353889 RepID=A0A6S6YHV2_9BURK|nr:hypothetical protein [Achromobacter pestifer]CAB3625427.1 hypothetical protein LMG3431_00159 [Achromobacter pestifer]
MIAKIQNVPKWLFSQLGQLVIAVGLLSLVFNYAYRFTVDREINSTPFYVTTVVLGLIAFLILRKDYVFVNRYEFSDAEITVQTLLGVKKRYATSDYEFVPSLHKALNLPEQRASLSFYIRDAKTKKNIRNYSWTGFSPEDFQAASRLYGYRGETDFSQKDFGKR